MALARYHNITGSTGVDVELAAAGTGANSIKSIMLTNVHATADATVTLFLYKATTAETFNIISTIAIPSDSSLLLDNEALLRFDNSGDGFSLFITVGSSDTVDVLISV